MRTRPLKSLLIPALVGFGLIAGFARELLLAYLYGASREVEIFRIAFGLPSVLSDSLALSFVAILLPYLLTGETRRPAQSLRLTLWASMVIALAVYLLGIGTMGLQARILAPGMSGMDRAALITTGWICWTTFLFVILSLPFRALLSIQGKIWPGAASQIMRSGGFAIALAIFALLLGWRDVTAPAFAAALGGATVLLIHVQTLGPRNRRRIRNVLRSMPSWTELFPVISALGVVFLTQLLLSGGRLMDRAAASMMDAGTLAALEYSYALLMAVAAILATSANLLLAPRLGRSLRDTGKLSRPEWGAIFAISAGATLLGLLLCALAGKIVPLVYQYGAFDSGASALTISVFRLHALALGPLVMALLLTQVLLLQKRQSRVVVASTVKIVVKLVALALVLKLEAGIEGVALTLLATELAMAFAQGAFFVRTQNREIQSPRSY